MRLQDNASEEAEFDFDAWAARSPKPTFEACAKSALSCLAVRNEDLRSRLRAALFCMLYVDPGRVPSIFRPRFDEISDLVMERIGHHQGYAGLKHFTTKLKMKTAKRLARKVFDLCLDAAVGEAA